VGRRYQAGDGKTIHEPVDEPVEDERTNVMRLRQSVSVAAVAKKAGSSPLIQLPSGFAAQAAMEV
jgi:hypothetical protein